MYQRFRYFSLGVFIALAFIACSPTSLVNDNVLTVDYSKPGAEVNPHMYGIFFEEINHSGDGALYGELIMNRNFEEHVIPTGTTYRDGYAHAPHSANYKTGKYSDWKIKWDIDSLKMVGWKVTGDACYDVTDKNPLHPNTPHALRLEMAKGNVVVENSGYWGIPVRKGDKYDLRFYLNGNDYQGNVTIQILSSKGDKIAEKTFPVAAGWKEYLGELSAAYTDNQATFRLQFDSLGKVYIDYVSLFPKETFKRRKNGLRKDIAQLLADMKPGFVRWPGGCLVEGATYGNHFQWKKTLGDPMQRHSEWGVWNYHCSWGFGYHEFLQFCEDIGADALLVANVGLSCSIYNGDYTENLDYIIQDISDAIEYATGDVNTIWGSKRADAGHPAPFPLKYIELGNNHVGDAYVKRYNYLYSILKPKFPKIHFISTSQFDKNRQSLKQVDLMDLHWYVHTDFFYDHTTLFDTIPRGKYHIYVGEYASVAAGNMDGALAEAAFMTGMERNGDLVKMASYAPLIENSNRRNWQTNLIRVKNGQAFGRSSYHVQHMFSHNIPTYTIRTTIERNLPNPIEGYIGFIGDNLAEQYRNVKVTSADGQVFMDGNDFSMLTEVKEDRPTYYRLNYQKIHLFNSAPLTEGVIEFEARAIPRVLKPDEPHPSYYNHKAIFNYPTLVFGSDQQGENRFNLNLGGNDDHPLMSVTRTINGDTGFDRDKEGTAFNMAPEEWHKFRIILTNKNRLICLVDNELIWDTEVKPYNQIHATSGYDKETGETIIKLVNGSGEAFSTRLRLQCEKIAKKGTITVLSASSKQEENSYEYPDKIVPKTQPYRLFGKEFMHVFPPYSFTIMRVKTSEK